jgi:hypothetical protein
MMLAARSIAAPVVLAVALSGCATIRGWTNADTNEAALLKGVAALQVLQGETYATVADLVDLGEMTPAKAEALGARIDEAGAYLMAARSSLTDGPGDANDARRFLTMAANVLAVVRAEVDADE